MTTVHPFVRLDFEPFDPTMCLSLLQTIRCGGQRAICAGLDALFADFAQIRPVKSTTAPRSLRRALLTPQVNPGSLYRRGKRD